MGDIVNTVNIMTIKVLFCLILILKALLFVQSSFEELTHFTWHYYRPTLLASEEAQN
jgi:hypothetical protein